MASHKKFTAMVAWKVLRHCERACKVYKNKDIDLSKSKKNYVIINKEFDFYKEKLNSCRRGKGKDAITLCSVIVTLPKQLNDYDTSTQDTLFEFITDFLEKRYGESNSISAIVHRDELGQPHLHYNFIPALVNDCKNKNQIRVTNYLQEYPDANNSEVARALNISRKTVIRWRNRPPSEEKPFKLSAFEILNKKDLQSFHKDLQNYIDTHFYKPVGKYFYTGITKAQGGNKTVEQLKAESRQVEERHEQTHTHTRTFTYSDDSYEF